MRISETYRVVLQHEEGEETTLYVHAPSQRTAETQAKRERPQATVQSCSPGDPPEGATLLIFHGRTDTESYRGD